MARRIMDQTPMGEVSDNHSEDAHGRGEDIELDDFRALIFGFQAEPDFCYKICLYFVSGRI